jgi:hypothetical protein
MAQMVGALGTDDFLLPSCLLAAAYTLAGKLFAESGMTT